MRNQDLGVEIITDPEPGPREVLVKTLACRFYGSDLHMFHRCEDVLAGFQLAESLGADIVVDPAARTPFQSWLEAAAPQSYDMHALWPCSDWARSQNPA